jgi:hypothetical protein
VREVLEKGANEMTVVLLDTRRLSRRQAQDAGISGYELARWALNPDLTVDMRDPRNAKYLEPLPDGDEYTDEAMANEMASISYNAFIDMHADTPNFEQFFDADGVYQQFLVDARRMLRDREYWKLFGGSDEDFGPVPNERKGE